MKKRTLLSCLAVLLCLGLAAAPDQAKIDAVARGDLKEARLSWWGFDKEDSTDVIKAALASKASTIIVDKMPSPWITKPVFLHSDMSLVFEDGAEMLAKRHEFKGRNDCLITVEGQKNVSIIGKGAKGILRMWKADYQDPKQYRLGEWRHGVCILSSDKILVKNMLIVESGGDGVYVAASNASPDKHPQDVTISQCVCDRNHRQGISVISAIRLLIEDTALTNTLGTPPEAGIDFEPNAPHESLIDCVMRNCLIEGNKGCGIETYLAQVDTDRSGPISLAFENCTVRNNRQNLNLNSVDKRKRNRPRKGIVTLKNCDFGPAKAHSARFMLDMHHDFAYTMENCRFTNVSDGKGSPVVIVFTPTGAPKTPSKFVFDNLQVIDKTEHPWLLIDDSSCIGIDGYNITGSIKRTIGGKIVEDAKIDRDYLAKYFPYRLYTDGPYFHKLDSQLKPAAVEASSSPMRMRSTGTFWLYAQKGQDISVTVNFAQLVHNRSVAQPVTIIYPSGKEAVIGSVEFKTKKALSFKAEEGGLVKLKMNTANNLVSLDACSVPCGICQFDHYTNNIYCAQGELYFYVPANAKNAALRIEGDGFTEGVNLQLFDPSGNATFKGEDVCDLLDLPLDNAKPGIWHMKIARPSHLHWEDLYITMIQIPPYMATRPLWLPVMP